MSCADPAVPPGTCSSAGCCWLLSATLAACCCGTAGLLVAEAAVARGAKKLHAVLLLPVRAMVPCSEAAQSMLQPTLLLEGLAVDRLDFAAVGAEPWVLICCSWVLSNESQCCCLAAFSSCCLVAMVFRRLARPYMQLRAPCLKFFTGSSLPHCRQQLTPQQGGGVGLAYGR
jgi:hypothetical protein